MRDEFASRGGAHLRLTGLALLGLAACAYPVVPTVVSSRVSPAAASDASAAPKDSSALIVEVRTYSISPTLSVIAWDTAEPEYGIRTTLARHGEPLPSGSRFTDHRLYVATTAIVEVGGVRRASMDSHVLRVAGVIREANPCDGGNCLPLTTYGVAIPDTLLRSARDSIVVKLYTRTDSELAITLRKDLVEGYLRKVDSVTASLRSPAPRRK